MPRDLGPMVRALHRFGPTSTASPTCIATAESARINGPNRADLVAGAA